MMVYVVMDTATWVKPTAVFTSTAELTGWLSERSNAFLNRSEIYRYTGAARSVRVPRGEVLPSIGGRR